VHVSTFEQDTTRTNKTDKLASFRLQNTISENIIDIENRMIN